MIRLIAVAALFMVAQVAGAAVNVLTWDDNSGNETGFSIERKAEICTGPGVFAAIATVAVSTATFTDPGVSEGQTYCYRVRASGQGGLFSEYSNLAQRTVPFTAPTAPSNLQVQGGP